MPNDLALKLQETVAREFAQLSGLTEADAAVTGSSAAWSKKEELGHLIDSAANNHVRFVRASLEPEFRGPTYHQNGWVERHGYDEMPWEDLLEFWRRYNALLAAVVRRIPEDRMQTPCVIGESAPVTLRFLIDDYVLHMQHHLDHILRRDKLTQYPGAALGV